MNEFISWQDIVDSRISDIRIDRDEKEITASSLGHCMRKLMLKNKGFAPVALDNRVLRVFHVGNIFEAFMLDSMRFKGYILEEQGNIDYKGINGRFDAIVNKDGKPRLIDVKSVHSGKFNYLEQGEVDTMYAMQLTHYYCGAKIRYPNLDGIGELIYISKDDLRIMSVAVIFNRYIDLLDKKIAEIEFWKKDKELPPEKAERDWECFSCKPLKAWCRWIQYCPKMTELYNIEQDKINKKKEVI